MPFYVIIFWTKSYKFFNYYSNVDFIGEESMFTDID